MGCHQVFLHIVYSKDTQKIGCAVEKQDVLSITRLPVISVSTLFTLSSRFLLVPPIPGSLDLYLYLTGKLRALQDRESLPFVIDSEEGMSIEGEGGGHRKRSEQFRTRCASARKFV